GIVQAVLGSAPDRDHDRTDVHPIAGPPLFVKQKTAYEMVSDWSSDVCSSDLTDDSWPRMPVVTHVTEALGSDIHVIFAIDAPPVEHKDLADLVPEQEEEGSAIPFHVGKSLWTARVTARSPVRAGDRIELGVDTRNLHFFDPDSGLAIGGTKIAASRTEE